MEIQHGSVQKLNLTGSLHDGTDGRASVDYEQWTLIELPYTENDSCSLLTLLNSCQEALTSLCKRHWMWLPWIFLPALVSGYGVYLGFVFTRTTSGWTGLLALTSLVVVFSLYEVVKVTVGQRVLEHLLVPSWRAAKRVWVKVRWVVCPGVLIGLIVYLTIVVVTSQEQCLALFGYVVFTSLALVTSNHVTQIQWQPVIIGLALQMVLAVVFLRWGAAYRAARWLAGFVASFLKFSLRGSTTAFGNPTAFLHPLFMIVCPVIMFVGAAAAFFSYIKLTPYIAKKLSWLFWGIFGISRIEAQTLADSFFSGMMDHVMTFRKRVTQTTPSEMQMTLVSAHSNLNAFMYSVFSVFWVLPEDLLLGALLALPAGVALCKMNAPEVHQTNFRRWKDITADEHEDKRNICEEVALGAWQAAKVVAAIVVQVVAFLSMYEMFDVILTWIGDRVNIQLNFKEIFSRMLMPVAYLLGVPSLEVSTCAYILGLGLSQNEVIAYLEMGAQRMASSITRRTAAVTSAAVGGFSSFASMTLVMGGWMAGSPSTYRRAIRSLWRVLFVTKLASLSTACLFGVLYDETLVADFEQGLDIPKGWLNLGRLLSKIPSYKQLLPWLDIRV